MRSILAGLVAALLLAAPAMAEFPDRPLRILGGFAAGGTSDLVSRIVAEAVTPLLGQRVVVENRTGASGNLAAEYVARSQPDGHTMLLTDAGVLATVPSLFSRLPFDVRRDFAPVTMLIYAPYILAVHPSVPARDAAELAAYAKANPNRINVAHAGIGSANQLTGLMVTQHWGAELIQVPYRGGAAALLGTAGGEAQMIVNGATATQPYVVNGQLRGIAVSGPRRLAALPDVPTFAELGWPATESGTWQGVLVPAATPPALVQRLDAAFRAGLAEPEVTRRLAAIGAEPRAEGPDAFRRWLESETETWGRVIRANNIRLD
jgi:tripartite-type tricarboxylate transporter receptor subunit TctC